MKKGTLFAVLVFFRLACFAQTEQWNYFETSLKGPATGNPFVDVSLSATFTNGSRSVTVDGFYDGAGIYKVRFMPEVTGSWQYVTHSNSKQLDHQRGAFNCVKATGSNHGPVRVSHTYYFKHADSTAFYPFGTTMYAWIHQGEALQQETLEALKTSGFNKLRMCVFPKYYAYNTTDPELYPYKSLSGRKGKDGHTQYTWDFKTFNPAFFDHLEKCVANLRDMGIEADIIIFHPYDKGRWGFDSMGKENDERYLKYLTARLSAFRNVWWSMANEFDYIKSKPRSVWADYIKTVTTHDAYHHLCSIHNGSVYYNYWDANLTHLSIQNGSAVADFGRAGLLRNAFFKPVIYDEVNYEGNLPQRWGQLSGQQLTDEFWQGAIAGTYVTHGEVIKGAGDTISWAKGGRFKGQSPARIAFLRKIMEAGPGPWRFADEWRDLQTAQVDSNYYIIYFGKQTPEHWRFSLPKKGGPAAGARYKVEVIDTWNMTIKPLDRPVEIQTPAPGDYRVFDKNATMIDFGAGQQYMALRITRL